MLARKRLKPDQLVLQHINPQSHAKPQRPPNDPSQTSRLPASSRAAPSLQLGQTRAATYYATALYRITGATDGNGNGEAPRQLGLWRRQRACWEKVVDPQPVPGERVAIPYEDTTLPAYVFRAPDA